jgi:hypothetical protein
MRDSAFTAEYRFSLYHFVSRSDSARFTSWRAREIAEVVPFRRHGLTLRLASAGASGHLPAHRKKIVE